MTQTIFFAANWNFFSWSLFFFLHKKTQCKNVYFTFCTKKIVELKTFYTISKEFFILLHFLVGFIKYLQYFYRNLTN